MTLPRTLGYSFNPLTVVHCLDRQGRALAVVYEVNNTAGARVNYVVTADNQTHSEVHARLTILFESSGLISSMPPVPTERLSLNIIYRDVGGSTLKTSFSGCREPFTTASVRRALVAYPLVALKVIAAIHFEALKI